MFYHDNVRTATQIRLGSGRLLDLMDPSPEVIDPVTDLAAPLSRIPRFGAQPPVGTVYCVAQHQVVGAAIALVETGRIAPALCFGLHDAHEGPVTDIPTPVAVTIGEESEHPEQVKRAIHAIKKRLDVAIARRLGTPEVYADEDLAYCANLDKRMFNAEMLWLWKQQTFLYSRPGLCEVLTRNLGERPTRFFEAVLAATVDAGGARIAINIDFGHELRPWDSRTAATAWLSAVEALRDCL